MAKQSTLSDTMREQNDMSHADYMFGKTVIKNYFMHLIQELSSMTRRSLHSRRRQTLLNQELQTFFGSQAPYITQYKFRERIYRKQNNKWLVEAFRLIDNALLQWIFPHRRNWIRFFLEMTESELECLVERILRIECKQIQSVYNKISDTNNIVGNKCVFITPVFPTTWKPTLTALSRAGWSNICLLQHDVQAHQGYGIATTDELLDDAIVYFHNFFGAMVFMAGVRNAKLLFSGEAYHSPNWSAASACCMFLNISAILSTVKEMKICPLTEIVLLMYDGLKPVVKNARYFSYELSLFYKRYLSRADKIIFNSNTERLGQFIANTYGITAPRLHFYRFTETLQPIVARRSFGQNQDEFHVVSITSFCCRTCCATRENTYQAVRSMLAQGIHFHYYTNDSKADIDWFLSTVPRADQARFHTYAVNRDQQALVNELHQYHAGFNGSHFFPFIKGIYELWDRNYGEGMLNFMLSTFGTSFHVYVAAGVPPIIPGCCADAAKFYDGFTIPMNLSEFNRAKQHFMDIDLPSMCKKYKNYSHKASIEGKIEVLSEFLDVPIKQEKSSRTSAGKSIPISCTPSFH